jgi:hypothetical protein
MSLPTTASAVQREADWLNTVDALPALPASAGGPFGIVQAYWPGNRIQWTKSGLYVTRHSIADNRPAGMRYRPQYEFVDKLVWPIRSSTMIAEKDQQQFDDAIELLLQRIRGLPVLGQGGPADKTHGSRFLSVGQVPEEQPVTVDMQDAETTIQQTACLRAEVRYYADDLEFVG